MSLGLLRRVVRSVSGTDRNAGNLGLITANLIATLIVFYVFMRNTVQRSTQVYRKSPISTGKLRYVRYGASEILSQSELSTHVVNYILHACVGSAEKKKKTKIPNMLEPDRSAACVIAQQYSSATFVLTCALSFQQE